MVDVSILSFSVVAISIAFVPLLAEKFRLHSVVAEVGVGLLVGPYVLGIVKLEEWLDFLGVLGLIFLLFLAGLECNLEELKDETSQAILIGATSFSGAFIAGYAAGKIYGLDNISALLIGVVLSATSIGIVLPLLKELKLSGQKIGRTIISGAIIAEILSISVLSVILAYGEGTFSLLQLTLLLSATLTLIIVSISVAERLSNWWLSHAKASNILEVEMRVSLALLAVFMILAAAIGIHAILGAFFAGLILAQSVHMEEELESKLSGLGFGFLIPIFFFTVGIRFNLPNLLNNYTAIAFALILVALALITKYIGIYTIAIFRQNIESSEGKIICFSMGANLTVALAAAEAGRELGFISSTIYSTIVLVALITTLITPIAVQKILYPLEEGQALSKRVKIVLPPTMEIDSEEQSTIEGQSLQKEQV